eukprot:7426542-Pyramimonas_sp.AAC.2
MVLARSLPHTPLGSADSGIAFSALWSRALAGDLLAIYSRIAPVRWNVPQFAQAPRSRHSGTQVSRSCLGLPHRLLRNRDLAALRGTVAALRGPFAALRGP